MQNEKIVDLYWQRDESAIQETAQKCDRYLTKIAYNILSNQEDREESVNDAYLNAWSSMPPHKPGILSTGERRYVSPCPLQEFTDPWRNEIKKI